MRNDHAASRIRARCILVGLGLIPANCYWVVAMEEVWMSGDPSTTSLFFNAVFTLLALLLLNAAWRRVSPRTAWSRMELLTIYSMVCVGTGICSRDFIQVALPTWAHVAWHATDANHWAQWILPEAPSALIVTDKEALADFYQGHSTLYLLRHLRPWLQPVCFWAACFTVLQIVMLCLNVIFRRQWTDHEKLSFPIAQLPLEMTAPQRTFWRSRALWLGFGLAAALDLINGLHFWYPVVPGLNVKMRNLQAWLPPGPWQRMDFTPISFFPFVIGIGYLLPVDLSFSCWFFYLFFKAQLVLGAFFGWEGSMGWDTQQGSLPYVNEQGIGAYLALLGFALWAAREHLRAVVRTAFPRRGTRVSEAGSSLPSSDARAYRIALWGLILGLAWLVWFSRWIGMGYGLATAFFVLYFGLALIITKIRAELGPPVHDLHFGGPDRMLVTWIGTESLSRGDLMGLSLFFGFNRAYRGHPMPHQLEGLRMAEVVRADPQRMAWALLLAAPVAAVAACWAMLHWAYAEGMVFTRESYRFGSQAWIRLEGWLRNPWPASSVATAAMGVGAAFASALMALRLRFVGFPFHPIGYAISANWAMNCVWMPLLIAWLAKVLTLRYSGARGYRAAVPLALGVILGEFVVGSLWSLVGLATHRPTYEFWLF
jgi:hypothetical protein